MEIFQTPSPKNDFMTKTCWILKNLENEVVFIQKYQVPKKIIFENGKLNALWYFLHLPILAYATWKAIKEASAPMTKVMFFW